MLPDALNVSFAHIQFGLYLMVGLGILIIALTAFLNFEEKNEA
jgi:hypothetical protein